MKATKKEMKIYARLGFPSIPIAIALMRNASACLAGYECLAGYDPQVPTPECSALIRSRYEYCREIMNRTRQKC